ncbi:MAG: hypothetical protein QM784_03250 [Polyangiaceae bacterium]
MHRTLTDNSGCVYRIDSKDRIVHVGGQWQGFAEENGAPHLEASRVVGTSLWSFVAGEDVRRLYMELFRTLRSERRVLIVPFNCDSPTVVRHMTLKMQSLSGGDIELEGRLTSTRERPPVHLLDCERRRAERHIPICSFCRRVPDREEWLALESAVVRKRLLAGDQAPALKETVCPECEAVADSIRRPPPR